MTEISCLSVLEARSPRSTLVLSKGSKHESVPCLSLSFWFDNNPWYSLAYTGITLSLRSCLRGLLPVRAHLCPHFPFSSWLRSPTLLQYDLFLTNHTYNDLISKSGHILRYYVLGHQHMNLRGGGTTQPITVSVAVSLSSGGLTLHNTKRSLHLHHLPQCLLAPIKCLLRQ